MGIFWSKLFGKKEMRIMMLGLDASGKTTILYRLKLGEVVSTIPTIGFNIETLRCKNLNFTVWDVNSQDKMRPLWRHYYPNTKGLIFPVDCNDRERISEAREEMHRIISDGEMQNVPVLIFANKQDFSNAMKPEEVQEEMGLKQITDRKWYVQPSSAMTGEGLWEGLEWLSNNYKL